MREGFDSIAARYDVLNDIMTMGLHRRWKREAVARLDLQPKMRVLDLCAGTGDLSRLATPHVGKEGVVSAVDFSMNMMQFGQNRNSSIEHKIAWICADAECLPFESNCFDGAMSGFGLRNVTSIENTLHEIKRVLKPNALFISLDTAHTEWKFMMPFYRFYMQRIVPFMGWSLAGSRQMYKYLSDSSEIFHPPYELQSLFATTGFRETGFEYRPRFIGGAALVWGRCPAE